MQTENDTVIGQQSSLMVQRAIEIVRVANEDQLRRIVEILDAVD